MRALFFMVCLVACKTTHSLDAASHTDSATAAQLETHETRQAGPEHIVMTVEEFGELCDPKETAPQAGGAADRVAGSPADHADSSRAGSVGEPAQPKSILTRRTVTVTDRGPSLDDLRTISSLQSKLNQTTTVKTKDESKPGGIFSLWFLVGLLPLVAGVLVWRLKPSLFGVAWGALKGLLK